MSRFIITFLPRSNYLLISWLQSPSTVTLEPKKMRYVSTSTFSPSICQEVMGPDVVIWVVCLFVCLFVEYLVLSPLFQAPPSPSSRGSLVSLCFLPLEWHHLHIEGCWCSSRLSWFQLVSSSPAFLMMCSVYRLNKQGDSRQPGGTPFYMLQVSNLPTTKCSQNHLHVPQVTGTLGQRKLEKILFLLFEIWTIEVRKWIAQHRFSVCRFREQLAINPILSSWNNLGFKREETLSTSSAQVSKLLILTSSLEENSVKMPFWEI